METEKIVIGIPAKNEEKTIGKVIKDAKKYSDWVYVFDDGSSDKTKWIAIRSGANVVSNPINLGKGATVRFAIRYLIDNKILGINDAVCFIDADGQCDVSYIPLFFDGIRKGCDMVVAKRWLGKYPAHKRFGNWVLNKFSSLLSGLNIKDSESGYRAFSYMMALDILRYSSSKSYGIEFECNVICGRKKHRLAYIPILESTYISGKGTKIWDGIKNILSGIICLTKIILERK